MNAGSRCRCYGHSAPKQTAVPTTPDSQTFDLRRHSLNTVVGHNKSLWKLPQQWTQAHLEALCVQFQEDSTVDDAGQIGNQPLPRAIIPILDGSVHRHCIQELTYAYSAGDQARALRNIVAFPKPPWDLEPRLDVDAPVFSPFLEYTIKLAVGHRSYRLPRLKLYRTCLGSLFIYYLPLGSPPLPSYDDPCIAAFLIALAQMSSSSTATPPPVRVQLLFRRDGDSDCMRVCTAHVSQDILERFRYPNKPPTASLGPDTTTPPVLVKARHVRIPYEPVDTFGCRLLAALSISATAMHERRYFYQYLYPVKRKVACDDATAANGGDRKRHRPITAVGKVDSGAEGS